MISTKKFITILTIFWLISLSLSLLFETVKGDDEWIIDGDRIYIDTDKFYASVTPHTIYSSSFVEYELMNKLDDDIDIDILFGFDIPRVKPEKKIYYWRNYTHYNHSWELLEIYDKINLFNITNYENLGIDNYDLYDVLWGTKNNTKLFSITYYDGAKNTTDIFAFTEFIQQGNNVRLKGNNTKWSHVDKTFFDWDIINLDYQKIKINYGGMNTWFLFKNQNIKINKLYKFGLNINIEIDVFNGTNGKYWYGFKPSSMTFQQAIDANKFYYIDPWYDVNWSYRKLITIDTNQIPDTVKNFPVCINITDGDLRDKAENNGNDILFIDYYDNTTKFNHEIEYFNGSTGNLVCWVNDTLLSSTNNKFWMYYNNSGASNQQNIAGTWDSDYLIVYHCHDTDNGLTDSTANSNDANEDATDQPDAGDYRQESIVGFCVRPDGSGSSGDSENWDIPANLQTNNEWEAGFHISYWFSLATNDQAHYIMMGIVDNMHTQCQLRTDVTLDTNFQTYDSATVVDRLWGTTPTTGKWYYLSCAHDGSANTKHLWDAHETDTSSDITSFKQPDAGNDFGSLWNDKWGTDNGRLDELRISKYHRNHTWEILEYNTMINATDGGFFTVGAEEYNVPPEPNILIINGFSFTNNTNTYEVCNLTFYCNIENNDSLSMNYTMQLKDNFNLTFYNSSGTRPTNGTIYLNITNCLWYGWNYTLFINMSCNGDTSKKYLEFRTNECNVTGSNTSCSTSGSDEVEVELGTNTILLIIGLLLFVFAYYSDKDRLLKPILFFFNTPVWIIIGVNVILTYDLVFAGEIILGTVLITWGVLTSFAGLYYSLNYGAD